MAEFATYPSLRDRVVFITGGASGIGAAFVDGFLAQGARVAFIDRTDPPATLSAWFRRCDVTDAVALQAAVGDAAADLGGLHVLINNVANDARRAADAQTAQAWRDALAVNLDPAFLAAVAAYPHFRRMGGGVVLNLSSINALLGPPGLAAYVAAKGAINALTKSLAREWGPDGVRVNAISPGWVVTERQLELWLTPEAEAAWMEQVALQTRILPQDVARLALFLASDDSALITGQNFIIDGGRT